MPETTTAQPLYFTSFEVALSREHRRAGLPAATGWADLGCFGSDEAYPGPASLILEWFLRLLETPWPWDTTCTSMGVCPDGARCAETSGFAIICHGGLVRDSVEPLLLQAFGVLAGKVSASSVAPSQLPALATACILLLTLPALVVWCLWSLCCGLEGGKQEVGQRAMERRRRRRGREEEARRRRGAGSDSAALGDDGGHDEELDVQGSDDDGSGGERRVQFVVGGSHVGRDVCCVADAEAAVTMSVGGGDGGGGGGAGGAEPLLVGVTKSSVRQLRAVVERLHGLGCSVGFVFPEMPNTDTANSFMRRVFDMLGDDPAVQWRPLSALGVPAAKLAKPPQPAAEAYVWLSASGFDFPGHAALHLDRDLQVVEGSSTLRALLKHFPPDTRVPTTFAPPTATELPADVGIDTR
jgi:hypothetical protein